MLDVRIDRKAYRNERTILSNIAFKIEPGEVVALLGPSGAGKTTLLRIMLDLDADFEGKVRRGHRRVGVMFQEPRLLPWLTVRENIRLVVTADMPQPDIDALLETVRLGQAGSLRPRQISLGMARRVALARALAVSPDLLVLDEPFTSLDAQLATAMADGVARYAQTTGASVILATHDLVQALDRVSRLLILAGCPTTLCADRPSSSTPHVILLRDFPFLRSGNSKAENAPGANEPQCFLQNGTDKGRRQ